MRRYMKICAVLAAGVVGFGWIGSASHGQNAPSTRPTAAPVFSEDFESGSLNKEIWAERVNNGGTVTVQNEVAAHGKSALKVHYPAGVRAYAFAVASKFPKADELKTHFFGRAYVNFPKPIPAGHVLFAIAGTEGWPTSNFFEIGNRQNKAQLSLQQNGANVPRGEEMIAGVPYPTGKWFCLEWEFNDKPDSIVIWIDGEKVTDVTKGYKGATEDFVKGFAEFGFGFRSWGNVPDGFDVYYDDIAFGTSRIGPAK